MKPLYKMTAPTGFTGSICCDAVGLSGRVCYLDGPGATIADVDERDIETFLNLKFTMASS